MKLLKLLKYFILFVFLSTNIAIAEEPFQLARIEKLSEQIIGESIIRAIFKEMNKPVEIVEYPGLRCTHMSSQNKVDGEMMRIYSYGEKNPSLIRVPTPYYSLETTVFLKPESKITVFCIENLKDRRLVIVRGVQHTTDIAEGCTNIFVLDSTEAMMKFINSDRADIALANRIDGLYTIQKLKFQKIIVPHIVLKVHDLYIYLTVKGSHLEFLLDRTIKKMKDTGELKDIIKQSERNYLLFYKVASENLTQ